MNGKHRFGSTKCSHGQEFCKLDVVIKFKAGQRTSCGLCSAHGHKMFCKQILKDLWPVGGQECDELKTHRFGSTTCSAHGHKMFCKHVSGSSTGSLPHPESIMQPWLCFQLAFTHQSLRE